MNVPEEPRRGPHALTDRATDRRLTLYLFLFLALLYVPFAGNYGMWDPWETHYSEVARQMLARGDYVSLWWPGSPQDRNEFWSKPVLTFWLMAIAMAVRGLGFHPPALPNDAATLANAPWDGEMAQSWAVEWAVRTPFILCAMACVWGVYELTRRVAGRRAALWTGVVLATSTQFFYIARQAMTDMAFVAPMTVALALAGLALLDPEAGTPESVNAPLPRREVTIAGRALSYPKTASFYALAALVALTIVPQLVLISIELKIAITVGHTVVRMAGIVAMLPYIACLAVFCFYAARATCRRQIYFHIAFLLCGLATLAKGPAGVAMPVIAIVVYLVAAGEWRTLLPSAGDDASTRWSDRATGWKGFAVRAVTRHPLEIGLGVLVFVAVTFPWYHAMLVRHGMGFWNEFIGDNYVHRAAGRHGDRGTFEYYIEQIGIGMFPWSAVVVAAILGAVSRLRGVGSTVASPPVDRRQALRSKLSLFAVAWFLVMFAVVSLVNTKFHHYILPGLPALAVLAGLFLDELFERPTRGATLALALCGLPLLVLSARDLSLFPARLTWLFDYDYVNAPNGGRPWPMEPAYDYKSRVAALGAVMVIANLVLAAIAIARARRGEAVRPDEDADARPPTSTAPTVALCLLPIATVIAAALWQPPFGDGTPHPLANGWILVGAAGSAFVALLVGGGLAGRTSRAATLSLVAVAMAACLWTGWALDRLLTDLSPHWSQKHVVAAYYKLRKGPDEPLIAWQMYWRGETFYTKNAIYDHRLNQADKTVFLGDHNAEKMQTWWKTHGGRRVFFIVERSRFESLRALLPEAARATLKPVDETNNKIYLAVATLPPSEPQSAADAKKSAQPAPPSEPSPER